MTTDRPSISMHRTAELPYFELWWFDSLGELVDFSTASSFTLDVKRAGATTAVLTKSSGITGDVGSGDETAGTPNVVVAWEPGDLDIEPDRYTAILTARFPGTLDRVMEFGLTVRPT